MNAMDYSGEEAKDCFAFFDLTIARL